MASIVFANGSKQMAHNLDDQYERWRLRREELPIEEQRENLDMFSDVLIQTVNADVMELDECETVKATLLDVSLFLNQTEKRISQELKERRLPRNEYVQMDSQVKALRYLKTKCHRQVTALNARIKELNIQKSNAHDIAYAKWLRHSIVNAKRLIQDDVARQFIDEILDANFKPGDEPLFSEAGS